LNSTSSTASGSSSTTKIRGFTPFEYHAARRHTISTLRKASYGRVTIELQRKSSFVGAEIA
jgi:hypothetical protein